MRNVFIEYLIYACHYAQCLLPYLFIITMLCVSFFVVVCLFVSHNLEIGKRLLRKFK